VDGLAEPFGLRLLKDPVLTESFCWDRQK